MSDIEVEAVDSIESIDASKEEMVAEATVPSGIDAPEYILYGGKGGVGKTTCAAATALASANGGTATLIISTDPAHSLSDILQLPVPSEPTRISDEHPLYGVEIDPEAADSPFDFGHGNIDDIFEAMDESGMGMGPEGGAGAGTGPETESGMGMGMGASPYPMNPAAMPGADETAAMQLLLEYLDDPRFDRVVVDTAPTGHTLRLLSLPELMDSMMGRFLSFRDQIQNALGNMPGPFGNQDTHGMDQLDELSDRIERLRSVLRDPERTEFRVVMVPEEMSVIESERLLDRLDDFGIPTGTVVVNRITEDLEQITGEGVDWFVTPNVDDCDFCQSRWQSQQKAIQRAQEVFRGRDIKRVPLFAAEIRGPSMLRVVAACLD